MEIRPGISVVICCYNSEKRIIPTLEHLANQDTNPELLWEVILVNNGCTDNTVEVASAAWPRLGSSDKPTLHIVEEQTPGLSSARKAGIFAARYNIICFCDDDNWLDQHYLTTAVEIMNSNQDIGVLAGKGIAVSEQSLPDWFAEHEVSYACGELAERSGDVTKRTWVWGAGMILRNAYIRKLYTTGFTQIADDRKEESLSSGGDTEICYWHILTGKRLWYDNRLIFRHQISPARLTKEGSENLFRAHEISFNQLKPYFPLIFFNDVERQNKLIIFLKALRMVLLKQEGSQLFVHVSPIFDSFLDPRTIMIRKLAVKFKLTQ